jgi:hypothetical protein
LLLAIGFALRLAGTRTYGLNLDEAQFLYVSLSRTWSDLWRYGAAESPHPLTYMALLHLMAGTSRDLLWLRLPSILSGTALIWVSERFGRQLLGVSAGLAMAVLVTFSPALIDLSRVCRNYAPGFPFLVAALWYLVRFLRSGRWRDFAVFALMETLAAAWVFTFVLAFVAMNLTLVAALVARRAPLGSWVRAALFQLPPALLVGLLYALQMSRIPAQITTYHHWIYSKELSPSLAAAAEPLRGVWQYLAPIGCAEACLWLSLLGLVWLIVRRELLTALLCAGPIALAYVAAAAKMLPLGNTRHGTFLFPFLFALVASLVPPLLRAARQRRATAAVVALAAAGYVGAAMLDYARPTVFEPLEAGRGRDLLRYYRQADVDRAFGLLESRAAPEDLVMMSVGGIFVLRAHLATCGDSAQEAGGDVDWPFPPSGPMRYRHRGVTFFMAPSGGLRFTPESFGRAVQETRRTYGLDGSARVWAIRSAKESPLADGFRERYPAARVDADVIRESGGWLFAVDGLIVD